MEHKILNLLNYYGLILASALLSLLLPDTAHASADAGNILGRAVQHRGIRHGLHPGHVCHPEHEPGHVTGQWLLVTLTAVVGGQHAVDWFRGRGGADGTGARQIHLLRAS